MINNKKDPFSIHTFMLPLKWDYMPNDKALSNCDFEVRTDLQKFHKSLFDSGWERKFYRIHKTEDYNEFVYFHDYVRKALFDQQEPDEKQNWEKDKSDWGKIPSNKFMAYYEKIIGGNATYKIETKNTSYTLQIKSICLHVFSTGVLILAYNCENHSELQKDEASILAINEYGRRIYPQFLSINDNYQSNENIDNKEIRQKLTDEAKSKFLASKISIYLDNGTPILEDDFSQYDDLNNLFTKGYYYEKKSKNHLKQNVIKPPLYVTSLFNDTFVFTENKHSANKIRLSRVTDDRMFFLCWYNNTVKVNELAEYEKVDKHFCRHNSDYLPKYALDSFWYAFMFGDKDRFDPSIKDDTMQVEHILQQTYSRWFDSSRKSNGSYEGTLYGLTRDSFVCLGGTFPLVHMKTMYYQIAVLCLAQRTTTLRFSGEVANLTPIKNQPQKMVRRIRSLHLHYVEFINKLYFREVTSQIQGIEIYNMLQNSMHIHRDVKDLDNEIQELHSYVTMYEQSFIAQISKYGVPLSIIFGILGANIFGNELVFGGKINPNAWLWIGLGVIISLCLGWLFSLVINKLLPFIRKRTKLF